MELENIVANTVLLKAREGKLTHVNGLGAGLAVFDFELDVREKVGNGRVDDGSRSARLSTAGNPPPPFSPLLIDTQMQQFMSLMQCYGEGDHTENDSSGARPEPGGFIYPRCL